MSFIGSLYNVLSSATSFTASLIKQRTDQSSSVSLSTNTPIPNVDSNIRSTQKRPRTESFNTPEAHSSSTSSSLSSIANAIPSYSTVDTNHNNNHDSSSSSSLLFTSSLSKKYRPTDSGNNITTSNNHTILSDTLSSSSSTTTANYTIGSTTHINPIQSINVLRRSPPSSSASSSSSLLTRPISYASNVHPPSSLVSTSSSLYYPFSSSVLPSSSIVPEPLPPTSLYSRVLEQQNQRRQSLANTTSLSSSSSSSSTDSSYIPSLSNNFDTLMNKRIQDALSTLHSLQTIQDDMHTIELLDNLIFKRIKNFESSYMKSSKSIKSSSQNQSYEIINLIDNHPYDHQNTTIQYEKTVQDTKLELAFYQYKQSLTKANAYEWLKINDNRLTLYDYEQLSIYLYPLSLLTLLIDSHYYRNLIIGRCDTDIVTLEKLQCLNDKQWLNDEVINFHMKHLHIQNRTYHRIHPMKNPAENPMYFLNAYGCTTTSSILPRVWVCSSFFLTSLMGISNDSTSIIAPRLYSHAAVAKWSKRANINLSLLDLIIIPVNIPNSHWVLVVFDVNRCSLHYYDSMNPDTTLQSATVGDILHYPSGLSTNNPKYNSFRYQVCASIAGWAVDEWKTITNEIINPSSWLITIYPSTHVPQQNNDYDCGMFMCLYATAISQGQSFRFTQTDIPYERKKLALDIIQSKADGSGLPNCQLEKKIKV